MEVSAFGFGYAKFWCKCSIARSEQIQVVLNCHLSSNAIMPIKQNSDLLAELLTREYEKSPNNNIIRCIVCLILQFCYNFIVHCYNRLKVFVLVDHKRKNRKPFKSISKFSKQCLKDQLVC
jgi:hypothetical protein